jgi:hypothetical protein
MFLLVQLVEQLSVVGLLSKRETLKMYNLRQSFKKSVMTVGPNMTE